MAQHVYKIVIDGVTRYIGRTNDLKRRQREHNYLCFDTGTKKKLYDRVRGAGLDKIELVVVQTFTRPIEAKRFECFLILWDYFNEKRLWQSVPKITDI